MFVRDPDVVDAGAAAPDESARFAVRRHEDRIARECLDHRQAGVELRCRDQDRRQRFARPALLERRLGRSGCPLRLALAVCEAGGFIGQAHLGLVGVRSAQTFESADFGERKLGEEAEETADVCIGGVAPELPVVIRAAHLGVEPHRAARCLAHLLPVRRGDERRGEAVERRQRAARPVEAARQLDAIHDVAPLVRAPHLQDTSLATRQLSEVVRLQDHVVELEETEGLFALQPEAHRIEGQHPVDREVPTDGAQELDVPEFAEPVLIVNHDRICRPVAEGEKPLEDAPDAGGVRGDRRIVQQPSGFVLARGIADAGRAAADQHDRPMAGPLKMPEEHDLQEAAYVEAGRRTVEADVGADRRLVGQQTVEVGEVGALVHVAPFGHALQEGGSEVGHGSGTAGTAGMTRESTMDESGSERGW